MEPSANIFTWSAAATLVAAFALACGSVQDQRKVQEQRTPPAAKAAEEKTAKTEAPKAEEPAKPETKAAKKKAVEVEGVISSVGQRTITFQMERKGKIREEVVGVDEKTDIEKGGAKVKLRDLQEADQALINYEPEAYTPAIAIKVTGKGEIKKVGGDD
jgi:hypothetical protein